MNEREIKGFGDKKDVLPESGNPREKGTGGPVDAGGGVGTITGAEGTRFSSLNGGTWTFSGFSSLSAGFSSLGGVGEGIIGRGLSFGSGTAGMTVGNFGWSNKHEEGLNCRTELPLFTSKEIIGAELAREGGELLLSAFVVSGSFVVLMLRVNPLVRSVETLPPPSVSRLCRPVGLLKGLERQIQRFKKKKLTLGGKY